MTRPASLRLLARVLVTAAAVTGTVLVTPAASTAATPHTVAKPATRAAEDRTPLAVSLQSLAPATIPSRGRVTLTGQITNRSKQTWTDLNVYLFTSDEPLTDRAQLADAAGSEADATIGNRRTASGLYDKVGDLGPGESEPYRVSVRRQDLGISGAPGVYWVGIHVLGATNGIRDRVADGRARTFMPLMPSARSSAADRTSTRLALVVPFRQPVQRGASGRLLDVGRWNAALSPGGRLRRLLDLSHRSQVPFTWLVDPALLDAVSSVAHENPPIDSSPSQTQPSDQPSDQPSNQPSDQPSAGSGSASGSPSGSASGSPSGSPSGNVPSPSATAGSSGTPSSGSPAVPSTAAENARSWLEEFRVQAPTRTVASLPYGDLDVAAALGGPVRSLYARAAGLSATTMPGYGVAAALPVVAPTSGYLPQAALRRLRIETPVLLGEAALPDLRPTVLERGSRAPLVRTDAAAAAGGPDPAARYDALGVRQRLLAESALHALSSQRHQPLVVSLPAAWDPGSDWASSRFFAGLDQPWLRLVDLPSVLSAAPTRPAGPGPRLVYPTAQRVAEVPVSNLGASRELDRVGGVYARLLSANDTVDDQLGRVAMLGSSLGARRNADLARARTSSSTGYVRSQMARVRIEGPQFVMMSGESGPIQVTLVNDLDQPVTVGLRSVTPGSNLHVEKFDPVTLGPGRRTSVRLEASSADIGVHAVTLLTTDADGVPLGSETRFVVRTSHVSTVIWVIMGAAGGLLLVAIVVRLFRRIRRRRSTHGPLLPPNPSDQEHPA